MSPINDLIITSVVKGLGDEVDVFGSKSVVQIYSSFCLISSIKISL